MSYIKNVPYPLMPIGEKRNLTFSKFTINILLEISIMISKCGVTWAIGNEDVMNRIMI